MERRRSARWMPPAGGLASRVRLRAGGEMVVVDASRWGVLVEGRARLLPGTHVDVHVTTRAGRTLVRSRVARCFVTAVSADAVTYRGGIAFERAVDLEAGEYALPAIFEPETAPAGQRYPIAPPQSDAA